MDGGDILAAVVRFVVPGMPRGKARPRAAIIAGRPRMYTPKVTASEEGAVRLFASRAMQGREPLSGPIDLRIAAYMPVPASWSGRKRSLALDGALMPTGKPDVDNIGKLISDGLNHIVMRDDAQVVSLSIWKRYSAEPRVVVEVRKLGAVT